MAKNMQIQISNGKPVEKKKPKSTEQFSVELLPKPSGNLKQRIVLKFSKIAAKKTSQKSPPSLEKQRKKQGKRPRFEDTAILQNTSPREKKQKPNEETSRNHPNCRRRLFADSPKWELKLKLRKDNVSGYFVDK